MKPSEPNASPSTQQQADWQKPITCFLKEYQLKPEKPEKVFQAFVHKSYAFEHDLGQDNERLEFLGDSVLDCLAADFLFRHFPDAPEGDLSRKKSYIVSRKVLAARAETIGLPPLLLLGHGEEESGGRRRVSVTGSALEALIGALYYEVAFETLAHFVTLHILEPALEALERNRHPDFKSRLQELVQKTDHHQVPEYIKTGEEGPPHNRLFVVEVRIAGKALGRGAGPRIKTAENRAAEQAYHALRAQMSG